MNFFSGGARKRKIVRENFCEVATGAKAGGGAESVRFRFASPRTPRVRDISDFENRCELGKIETPKNTPSL
ncbi:MAG: hypothetical protein COV79_00055 [Parcubacteria group bacterium CG11_big_fil_rev_8_21_14_0_20_41_14]|nr:MAG: hypothetical protein COW93_02455 [Parcubacteria group bacterium CG22_combo_CG10-13_8_21_14_all_41_9]PIQ80508.1 MAG: hypothetical protein COV79_00055 [Parcubacteria group bacterium CG11_big_fil_rev_8_21_14_0_20_41_14]PIR57118.1 MAG: hypothetical protein COU72_02690 [Parcubacteria group bacterium CG10_big_fil_rev_8_21_14_0_10_41_35]